MAILLLNTPEAGLGLAEGWIVASARVGVFNFIYVVGIGRFGGNGVILQWGGMVRSSVVARGGVRR